MNDAAVIALSPETVLGEMKKNGVTHVVWLPDSETICRPRQPPSLVGAFKRRFLRFLRGYMSQPRKLMLYSVLSQR